MTQEVGDRYMDVHLGDIQARYDIDIRATKAMVAECRICSHCLCRPRTIVNFPCRCFSHCCECAAHLTNCSMCNTPIQTTRYINIVGFHFKLHIQGWR